MHVGDFLTETIGRLKLSDEQKLEIVNKAIPIFELTHPNRIAVFAFDHSSSHTKVTDDALNAFTMNLSLAGGQTTMMDIIFDGKVQKMVFPDDTGKPGSQLSGKGNATFYDPNVAISACGQQHYDNELIGAMNKEQYGNFANSDESPVCGICIKVTGPKGSVKKIADLDDGVVPITWEGC
nr:7201_t:CDS:2 [Entrophospora candida]